MPSRSLDDLDPRFRPVAEAIIADCATEGLPVKIVMTLRTAAEQDALYAQGRALQNGVWVVVDPHKIVTKAHSGQSAHEVGLAMDIVPMELEHAPGWNPMSVLWSKLGVIVHRHGAEWGGAWKSFPDLPHVQAADWKALAGRL